MRTLYPINCSRVISCLAPLSVVETKVQYMYIIISEHYNIHVHVHVNNVL